MTTDMAVDAVINNDGLIKRCANSWCKRANYHTHILDFDDLHVVGQFAVYRAIVRNHLDPNKTGWVWTIVSRAIRDEVRNLATCTVDDDDPSTMWIESFFDDYAEYDEYRKQVEWVRSWANRLSERQSYIIDSILSGRGLGEIADDLGVTANSVRVSKFKALRVFKKSDIHDTTI
jgi:DNA-directed RNA polymerase specialized sigma24 family protein